MCSGDGDGDPVILHDLSEEISAAQHGNSGLLCRDEFRVIRMDRRSVDDGFAIVFDVVRRLSDEDLSPFIAQTGEKRGIL